MHIDVVPNRGARPASLLRESYREGARVHRRTLAHLSSRARSHVHAVRVAMQRLGGASLVASTPSRAGDVVLYDAWLPGGGAVHEDHVADSQTFMPEVQRLRQDVGIEQVVLVGDRGMISSKAIEALREADGIGWITALKSASIRALVEQGQVGLFDERHRLELRSPDYPGERLVACRNPELATLRVHQREAIAAEAALDGLYIIRTSVPATQMDAAQCVRHYKARARVERAFRSLKSIDLGSPSCFLSFPLTVRARRLLLCQSDLVNRLKEVGFSGGSVMKLRRLIALALVAVCALAGQAYAQSQAINGTIEGTVKDPSGGVLPGVTVTVTNTDTGTQRVVVTNESGVFRAPLLQLGRFTVSAELSGFSKYEQTGIGLVAGQTVVLNVTLRIGAMAETVTVSADAAVVDLGKTDVGRNINEREITNLPNVSRNPYNYALLQPGVTGTENSEFGVPRFSVNGQPLRVNYQVDGNTNTQRDRAGLRMMPMSEVMVREVQIITSGFAPEFGNTTGLVYNAVTPSGTNTFKGDIGYRVRQKSWSAFPFFFALPKTEANRPDNSLDIFTATVGGPVVRNSLHFYAGTERTYREMPRLINIDPGIAAQVGVAAQPGAVDAYQSVLFIIGKLDWQATPMQRVTGRTNYFKNSNPLNAGGGGNTALERSVDFADEMFSHAVQVVSTLGSSKLNELRLQVAQRHQRRFASEGAGTGVSVNISGGLVGGVNHNIQFGKPTGDGEDFVQRIYQVLNNFTWLRGRHNFKAGFDYQFIDDHRAVPLPATYTFPSVAAYLAARSGVNPKGYTTFAQTIAIQPEFDMTNGAFSAFVQDDWKVTPNFKLLYGVRYDLNLYNKGIPGSPYSETFNRDANNFAPRAGFAWTLDERGQSVLRGSSVVMYDQALLAIIEQSYANSGSPLRISVSLAPAAANAPSFPNVLQTATGTQSTLFAMSPDFVSGRTWQSNIAYERALGTNYSASVSAMYARGWNMPVINEFNHINPIRTLDDGRGVYSTAVNANTRRDPRFNRVRMVESPGESWYKAMTLQVGKRWNGSLQFNLNYTLAKGVDTAPLGGAVLSVQGDAVRSDPANLARDKGPNSLDVRHTLNGSIVTLSNFTIASDVLRHIVNNNQVSLLLQINSGIPVQITGNADLNADGNGNDRPLFIKRNGLDQHARYNVDMRYSRFFNFYKQYRLEVQAEFKNVFNKEQVSGVQTIYAVNATTGVTTPPVYLPASAYELVPTSGYEQRKFQLGFKLFF